MMAETQREPVPRNDAGEKDTALAFLNFARHCVLKKTEGLADDQLRRVMVGSGTSLLGLVQHLVDAERYWFGYHVAGHGVDDFDFSMEVPPTRPVDEVLQAYRDAIAASDDIMAAIPDFDQRVAIPIDDNRHSVRWVVAHVTGDCSSDLRESAHGWARHAVFARNCAKITAA